MASLHTRRDFGRLFEEAARRLWIVASATAPRGLVDDVLQESALVGLNRFASFERGSHFGSWMAQIVRNVSLNHARKAARRGAAVEVDTVADSLPDRSASISPACDSLGELQADQIHFDDALESGLRRLTPDARACLLLHAVEGMQNAEIGELLNLPVGTVASHVFRARAALRDDLAQHAPTSHPLEHLEVSDDAQQAATQ